MKVSLSESIDLTTKRNVVNYCNQNNLTLNEFLERSLRMLEIRPIIEHWTGETPDDPHEDLDALEDLVSIATGTPDLATAGALISAWRAEERRRRDGS